MGCAECGDKKDFTPPVIEITNPEQLILFRKVVVPSSMGGPDEFPPAIGKYKNVLLFYEKTTEAYLYSSDGIPTAIGGDLSEILARLDSLDEGLADETADREEADNNLQEQIESIRAASDVVDIVGTYQELEEYDTSKLGENDIIRVLVDETHDGATSYYRWTGGEWEFIGALGPFYTQDELDQMFEDETDARDAADSALSSSIDSLSSSLSSEATARAQADATLQNAIDAEASARQSADADLSADIVAEANARSTADAEIEQAWQDEATARGTADQALQTALNNEIAARTTADSAIETRIGTIEAGILSEHDAWTAADTALSSAINNEVTARQNADTALQTAIDGKQNELTAGTGIDITNDVISVTNAGPTVVQTTGTSTTDVMSQNATTSMVFVDPGINSKIRIGSGGTTFGNESIAMGNLASTSGVGDESVVIGHLASGGERGESIVIGHQAGTNNENAVVIGHSAASQTIRAPFSVAIGAGARATIQGQFDISTGLNYSTMGYNNSNYRLLTGLYDPQSDHDAATKGYVDATVPTKTSDLTNDSDFQTGTDVATAVGAVDAKLNGNVMTELTMATDATKVEFTETKKNLSTGTTSTEVDTIPLASTTQAGILNAAGYQSIIDSQDRLDALAGGAVSIANLSANPSQSDLTTAWQTATGETTVFNRASIFDSTNGKNWTYFDNTSAWEVTGTVNQSITINNFSQGTAGLIVGDNTAGKVYAEQDGTGSVYGWDALNTRVTNVETATANIPSVVQTTGTSTTDVMSQNAVTSMVFADPSTITHIAIGNNAQNLAASGGTVVGNNSHISSGNNGGTALGGGASVTGAGGIAIAGSWNASSAQAAGAISIGGSSTVSGRGAISIGYFTPNNQEQGKIEVGSTATNYGYNNSSYRLLTGLYDPQSDHDAATKGYVDTAVASAGGAAEINATDWSALWQ